MASDSPNYTNISSTHGFVATVTISASPGDNVVKNSGGDILQGSGSLNFIIFMVIGFGATLVLLAVALAAFILTRRYCARRRQRRQADVEAAVTVLEPRKLYVVVHPGGTADVAHKDNADSESPRQLVLKHKPVELSSATIAVGDTIPAHHGTPPKAGWSSHATGSPMRRPLQISQLPSERYSPSVSRYANPVFHGEGEAGEEEGPLPQRSLDPDEVISDAPVGGALERLHRMQALLSRGSDVPSEAASEQAEDAEVLSQRFARHCGP